MRGRTRRSVHQALPFVTIRRTSGGLVEFEITKDPTQSVLDMFFVFRFFLFFKFFLLLLSIVVVLFFVNETGTICKVQNETANVWLLQCIGLSS